MKNKKYAIAMFFEKIINIDITTQQTQQRLELQIVEAVSSEEALGKALKMSQYKNNGFPLVFNTTVEL
jgi:late competence protein required for DNA uptake (superfamily II DNA/RNA helicase)